MLGGEGFVKKRHPCGGRFSPTRKNCFFEKTRPSFRQGDGGQENVYVKKKGDRRGCPTLAFLLGKGSSSAKNGTEKRELGKGEKTKREGAISRGMAQHGGRLPHPRGKKK